jgi:hypothetical protein
MLSLIPSRPEPELDATVRHLIDLRHLDGQRAGQAERHRRHQGAETDP